jgi:hypothetical protein
MEVRGRNWLQIAEQPKQNTPTTIRSAPQGEEAKLKHRIACKREGRRLEPVVGIC